MFKKIVLFTVVFSFFSANLFAYHFKFRKFEKRKTNDFLELSCSPKKGKSLKDAFDLSRLKQDKVSIRLLCGFSKQTNKELFSYYKKHLPKKVIAKALNSSGNMHNPAIVPLSKAFPDAFKSTTFFKDIESTLGEHCYKLYGMGREKFSIDTKNIHIWQPDIWLRFQKNDKCK